MKIVYMIEDFSIKGGAERIISEKANYLASFHHEITIISVYHDEKPMSYKLNKGVNFISLDIPFTPKSDSIILSIIYRIITIWRVFIHFQKVINEIKPDIIFFTMVLGAIILPLCKTKAKKIYESHSARSFTPYNKLFYWMEKSAYKVVCLTQDDAKEYQYANNVCVIPNFIDTPKQIVQDYTSKKAIAVGRLEYPKGFDRLIRCWEKIAKRYPDWQLDIYGEGSLYHTLQTQIDELHLNAQIRLCGRCENMIERYPNYSLHIMSSHYEGQPMVLIEAQACGLPSVTFNFKYGAKYIIKNEYNGYIVEQDDEKAFIKAISQLLSSTKLRKQLGNHALEIGKIYNKSSIFKEWEKLLSTI